MLDSSTLPADAIQICAAPICDRAMTQSPKTAARPQFAERRSIFILFSPLGKELSSGDLEKEGRNNTGRLMQKTVCGGFELVATVTAKPRRTAL
jgi:hypothetical protein